MQYEVDRLKDELRRAGRELAREREGAQRLRRALELAAAYFQIRGDDSDAEAAWAEIARAIRSGRRAVRRAARVLRDVEPHGAGPGRQRRSGQALSSEETAVPWRGSRPFRWPRRMSAS